MTGQLAMRLIRSDRADTRQGPIEGADVALINSSEDLARRARGGDEEAFSLIFDRFIRPITSFIYEMVGNRSLAEELAQETFVRAYKNLDSLRTDAKLSTWLFGISRNVIREWLRLPQEKRAPVEVNDRAVLELQDTQPGPDGQFMNKELICAAHRALQLLNEDQRMVFSLRVFQQRSYQEIAEITGFSITKVKKDLFRAREAMRRQLGRYLEVSK
jgi:RNA polymerase sigma-70 factor, ECF subfamily